MRVVSLNEQCASVGRVLNGLIKSVERQIESPNS